MAEIDSGLVKELEDQKALLTIQKEILALKMQITSLSRAVETPSTPPADKPAEPPPATPQEPGGNGDKEGSGEAGSEESPTETAGYLAEITAYEVLNKTAAVVVKKLGLSRSDEVLVLSEQCLKERCLPLSDLALHQTQAQIVFLEDQVLAQTSTIEAILSEREEDAIEKAEPPYAEIAELLGGWGGAVDAASALVKSVSGLLSQFATSLTFQERDVTLPVEALVTATAGAMPNGTAYLLTMGQIKLEKEYEKKADAPLMWQLIKLIESVHTLDEKRIRLIAEVVTPGTAKTIALTNSIAKHEATKAALVSATAATSKKIGELEIEKKHETDSDKKVQIQERIDLEDKELKRLEAELTTEKDLIIEDQEELALVKSKLSRANAEAEVAANLIKAFTTFFQGITSAPDKATLSTLAKAVLREYILTFDYLLGLSIHSGGAEMVKAKFLFWEWRTFIGGCAVSYTLTTTDGKVKKSGLEVAAAQREFNFARPTKTKSEMIPPGPNEMDVSGSP